MRSVLLALVVIGIIISIDTALAANSGLIATIIHTPGFPAYLGDLSTILSSPWIEDILKQYNISYADIKQSPTTSLIDNIEDEEWAQRLQQLVASESPVDYSTIESIFREAMRGYESGEITASDYIYILEVLSRVSGQMGYSQLAQEISQAQAQALLELIQALFSSNAATPSQSGVGDDSIISRIVSALKPRLPSVEAPSVHDVQDMMPSIKPSIPTTPLDLLFLLAMPAAVLILGFSLMALASRLLERRGGMLIRGVWRLFEKSGDSRAAGEVVRLYWRAVELVEKMTGKPMGSSLTHREYLALVERDLGEKAGAFRSLTLDYELGRFAGVPQEQLLPDALKSFRELSEGERRR